MTTQRINPDTIASFTSDGRCLDIQFKEGSTLKVRTSAAVLSTKNALLVGRDIVFPESLVQGGKPCGDGKLRCAKCDCLLEANDQYAGHCWTCAKEIEGIFVAIAAARHLKVSDPENLIRNHLKSNQPADANAIDGGVLLHEAMKGKK